MSVVNDAVQDGIAEGVIADDVVPAVYGELAGDEQRTLVVAIVDDLEQIAALLCVERLRSPIIDDEQSCTLERTEEPRQTSFAARLGKIGEQA